MKEQYFIRETCKRFQDLQDIYNLFLNIKENEVNYSSKKITFSVYFERYFEIYIVFYLSEKMAESVNLSTVVEYVNQKYCQNLTYSKCQISDENDICFILSELYNIMAIVLRAVNESSKLILECYNYEQEINKHNYLKEVINQISYKLYEAWMAKDYKMFLEIYYKKKKEIYNIDTYLSTLQKKQIEFAKNYVVTKQ